MTYLTLCALLFSGFSASVYSFGGLLLGPGKWNVVNVMKCQEVESRMLFKLDIKRHKINRTHDGFSGIIKLDDVLDESYAVRIDICKYVDGGCKPYQVMADESFEHFIKKYAASNVQRVLEMAKVDPPDFPVASGTYAVNSFELNYNELPENGHYGQFGVQIFIVKGGLEKGCVDATLRFAMGGDD